MLLLREFSDGKLIREQQIALSKLALDAEDITFGRGVDCSYSFLETNHHLSRLQATLKRKGDGWELHNGNPKGLRSANGVYYQGRRLESPLDMVPGTIVDLFSREGCIIQLEYVHATVQQDTYTGETNLSEAIAALRQDVAVLAQRLDEQDQHFDRVRQPLEELQRELDARMDGLGVEIKKLTDAIGASHERDIQQSTQLETHDKLIRKVGLGMAAALLSLGGWNLTNGNKDAITQSINILFTLAGGTGGTYLLQKENQKSNPLKPA